MIMKQSSSGHHYWEITQDGREWIFKPARHAFLADQEHAANTLARAWGFSTPESHTTTVAGRYGQAQAKCDAIGDLEYGQNLGFYDPAPIPWGDLTGAELADIAREHLLDWALANDDGRASNYIRTADGRIVGIDKGRMLAPGWQDWPGLAGDQRADTRSAQVSTGLYDAIRAGIIPRDVAETIRDLVMARAWDMQALPDATVRAILVPAFARRDGVDAQALADSIVERKHTLGPDFADLWTRVLDGIKS